MTHTSSEIRLVLHSTAKFPDTEAPEEAEEAVVADAGAPKEAEEAVASGVADVLSGVPFSASGVPFSAAAGEGTGMIISPDVPFSSGVPFSFTTGEANASEEAEEAGAAGEAEESAAPRRTSTGSEMAGAPVEAEATGARPGGPVEAEATGASGEAEAGGSSGTRWPCKLNPCAASNCFNRSKLSSSMTYGIVAASRGEGPGRGSD